MIKPIKKELFTKSKSGIQPKNKLKRNKNMHSQEKLARTLVARCFQSSSEEISKEGCHFLKKNLIYLVGGILQKF